MLAIVGNIEMYTFQRFQDCTNRSSDERVMAPRSKCVRAVILCFSGEDSGQTGDATGELRHTSHR
jgi:hypothetical protein